MSMVHVQFRVSPETIGELAAAASSAGHNRSEALRAAAGLYCTLQRLTPYQQRKVREILGLPQHADAETLQPGAAADPYADPRNAQAELAARTAAEDPRRCTRCQLLKTQCRCDHKTSVYEESPW